MRRQAMRRTTIALCAGVLTSCATTSDVVSTGPQTFMVSASGIAGNGSAGEQKAIALQKANTFCNSKGLQMAIIEVRLTDPKFATSPAAEVNFRCDKS